MTDKLLLALADIKANISAKKMRQIIAVYEYEKAKLRYKIDSEDFTFFEYEGRHYAYKSLGDGLWTTDCASLELMKVLKNYFISSGKMKKGGNWPGSRYYLAWTSDVYCNTDHFVLSSYGSKGNYYDGYKSARFAVLPQDTERK